MTNIKEIVNKLQSPGKGSAYQDEKMLEDFIADEVMRATLELRKEISEKNTTIDQLNKKMHRLEDEIEGLKKKK